MQIAECRIGEPRWLRKGAGVVYNRVFAAGLPGFPLQAKKQNDSDLSGLKFRLNYRNENKKVAERFFPATFL